MPTKSRIKNVEPEYFSGGDPFNAILIKRFGLDKFLSTAIIVLILTTPIYISAIINDVLQSTSTRIGLLDDFVWWIYQLLFIPATFLFFLWMPEGIREIITKLKENNVLTNKGTPKPLSEFMREFDKYFSHRIWSWIYTILAGIFVPLVAIPVHKTFQTWETSSTFIFYYTIFFWVIFTYVVLLLATRIILTIIWFNKLFKNYRVDVRVLHPDGAGGLSPLGSFSVKVGYLIGIYGLSVVATSYYGASITETPLTDPLLGPVLILLILVYLMSSPIIFFAPIGTAHASMLLAKNELITQISDQFEIETQKIPLALKANDDTLKRILAKIEELRQLHKIAVDFPVWPFNTANIIRFFSSILSPFALWILPIIIDILRK